MAIVVLISVAILASKDSGRQLELNMNKISIRSCFMKMNKRDKEKLLRIAKERLAKKPRTNGR